MREDKLRCLQQAIQYIDTEIATLMQKRKTIKQKMRICKYPGCSNLIPPSRSKYCSDVHMRRMNAGDYREAKQ